MPGHNAFQRNAFQRNAFQIVYSFVPTVTGGVIVGGSVTGQFRSVHTGDPSGGVIVGGDVTGEFRTAGIHVGIVTGGVIVGGSVHGRHFTKRRRLGSAGSPFKTIFRRWTLHRYKPRVSGGVVVGGSVHGEFYSAPAEVKELEEAVAYAYLPRVSGGVQVGGSVKGVFEHFPTPTFFQEFKYTPTEPVSHVGKPSGGIKVAAGVTAAFKRGPFVVDQAHQRLLQQIEEEDELLLMGAFDG